MKVRTLLIVSLVLIPSQVGPWAVGPDPTLPCQPAAALQQPERNLIQVGQIGGPATAVAVQGDYAYIGIGPRLVVLDITNPARPDVVGHTEPLPDTVEAVALAGSHAYFAAGYAGLGIVDISDPGAPILAGFFDTPGESRGVAPAGAFAYLADGHPGLRVINVSDPTNPSEAGIHNPYEFVREVALGGKFIFITIPGNGLEILRYLPHRAHILQVWQKRKGRSR